MLNTPLIGRRFASRNLFSLKTSGISSHVYRQIGSSNIKWTVVGMDGSYAQKTQRYYVGAKPAIGITRPEIPVSHCPPPKTIYHTFYKSSCTTVGAAKGGFSAVVQAENPCGTSTVTVDLLHINTSPEPRIKVTTPKYECPGEIYTFCDDTQYNFFTQGIGCSCPGKATFWEITPVDGFTIIEGGLNKECMRIRFDRAGTFHVKLQAQNGCGSSATMKTIQIVGLPAADFRVGMDTLPSIIHCAPNKLELRNLSQNATFFNWKVEPMNGWSFEEGTNAQSKHPKILFRDPGTYQIKLTAGNNCHQNEKSQAIHIAGLPSVQLADISDACIPFSATPSVQIKENDAPVTKWEWLTPRGNFEGKLIGAILFEDTLNWVQLKVANICGEAIATDSVRVTPFPKLNIPDSLFICSGIGPVHLVDHFDLAIPKEGEYVWKGHGISNEVEGIFDPKGQTGIFELKVKYRTGGGCNVENQTLIIVEPAPQVRYWG
ncbi:MAG: hypothetical protein IPK21_15465 [Haliscomenobacter sp.]|nr:hypothetical protein [Haliscomenobacter sp.]